MTIYYIFHALSCIRLLALRCNPLLENNRLSSLKQRSMQGIQSSLNKSNTLVLVQLNKVMNQNLSNMIYSILICLVISHTQHNIFLAILLCLLLPPYPKLQHEGMDPILTFHSIILNHIHARINKDIFIAYIYYYIFFLFHLILN